MSGYSFLPKSRIDQWLLIPSCFKYFFLNLGWQKIKIAMWEKELVLYSALKYIYTMIGNGNLNHLPFGMILNLDIGLLHPSRLLRHKISQKK